MPRHTPGERRRPQLPEQAAAKAKAAIAKPRPARGGAQAAAMGKKKRAMRRQSGSNPFRGIR